ncbi:MAG: beta-ketoacyl-ACP synthase II [Chloroflexota bacterium]
MQSVTRRVVITGMGALTPLGTDVESTWRALIAGESGLGPITQFDATGLPTRIAGEIKGFDPQAHLDRKEARRMDRFTQLAVVASRAALEHAGLEIDDSLADDVGVIVGSGVGGLQTMMDQFKVLFDRGADRLSPFFITMMLSDLAAGQVAIVTGARGPNFAVASACATGAHAIGEAAEIIRRGDARVMLAGGSEAPVTPVAIGSFGVMHALSRRNDDPMRASRPFDLGRDGFVLSEGVGMLVLEDEEFALSRGATPLAVVAGYGATADAHHVVEPPPGGMGAVRAMRRALQRAGLAPEEIGYINAHGTSTPANDRAETAAVKTVFGDAACRVPMSSTKGATGHMLGGGAAIEAIFCVKSMQTGILPPTINYETPDPECDLDYVPNAARHVGPYRATLSNSFGFGGHNASLVLMAP